MTYPWQQCYRDAVLELDPRKLAHKIKLAEEVILQRLKELNAGPKATAEENFAHRLTIRVDGFAT
jgi:hypothetical protein